METKDIIYDSLQKYFKVLSQYGYKTYGDVNKVLLLIYIDRLLNGNYGIQITEEDYRIIDNSLYCVFGNSCLISYPTINVYDTIISKRDDIDVVRLSDIDEDVRITEGGDIRSQSK